MSTYYRNEVKLGFVNLARLAFSQVVTIVGRIELSEKEQIFWSELDLGVHKFFDKVEKSLLTDKVYCLTNKLDVCSQKS